MAHAEEGRDARADLSLFEDVVLRPAAVADLEKVLPVVLGDLHLELAFRVGERPFRGRAAGAAETDVQHLPSPGLIRLLEALPDDGLPARVADLPVEVPRDQLE